MPRSPCATAESAAISCSSSCVASIDLLQVHGVVARDAAHALDRAREAEGRRERRAEVVTGVDDEVREIAGFSAHGRARLMDADAAP